MADRGHADGDQVLSRQVRQNVSVSVRDGGANQCKVDLMAEGET
jgi:hypothetical protein